MRFGKRSESRLRVLLGVAALALLVSLVGLVSLGTLPAAAEPPPEPDCPDYGYEPGQVLGPRYTFSPTISAALSDTRAGAHADLNIRVKVPCRDQDLRTLKLSLPPGLLPDVNATPWCDYNKWSPNRPEYCNGVAFDGESMIGALRIDTDLEGFLVGLWSWPGVIYNVLPGNDAWGEVTEGGPAPWPRPLRNFYGLPDPTEHGQLMVQAPLSGIGLYIPTHVRVRPNDQGIDTHTTLPHQTVHDWPSPPREVKKLHIFDMAMTFFGQNPEGQWTDPYTLIPYDRYPQNPEGGPWWVDPYRPGHPLLTNPYACGRHEIKATLTSWGTNDPLYPDPFTWGADITDPQTREFTIPLEITGCDRVPYHPRIDMSLDTTAPEAAPAITTTITQAPGESPSKDIEVHFPRAFNPNFNNEVVACTDDQMEKDECPAESVIGTVEADSYLLPKEPSRYQDWWKPGPLKGKVYLGRPGKDAIRMRLALKGFIDVSLDGYATLEADGSAVVRFPDLPQLPITSFTMSLQGGSERGLLKNPRVCGPRTVTSTFKAHSQKTVRRKQTYDFLGCADPTLEASLSTRRAGEPTDLDLTLSSPGTRLKSVELILPRRLHWGYRKRLSPRLTKRLKGKRKWRLKSVGTATFTTSSGERKVRLKSRRTKRGNLAFAPLLRKTKEGQMIAAQVPGFAASLFRTARNQPDLLAQKKRLKRRIKSRRASGKRKGQAKRLKREVQSLRSRHQANLTLKGLPQEELTALELSLRGSSKLRRFYLKNPTGCERPLNFVALVTTADGRTLALKDQLKIRGRGCQKKKRRKRG